MIIQNTKPFGRFVPGDQLTIPDGSIFDHAYWVHMAEVTHEVTHEQSVTETVEQPVTETVTELEPVED